MKPQETLPYLRRKSINLQYAIIVMFLKTIEYGNFDKGKLVTVVFVVDLNGWKQIKYINIHNMSIECYSNVRWGSLLEPACMQRTEVDLEKNRALNCDSQPDNFET